jgi:acyl carrier protein
MRSAPADEDRSALRDRLDGLGETDQIGILLDLIQREAAAILGHSSAQAVPPDRAFKELGFDSLTAVELRNRLNVICGLRLPATAVFDHPHPAALATFLHSQLHGIRPVALASEIDRVEKLLDGLRPDDQEYVDCLNRIEDLLRRNRRQREAPVEAVADSDVIDNIDSATDDEIFGFINAEFGITSPHDADKALSEGAESVD